MEEKNRTLIIVIIIVTIALMAFAIYYMFFNKTEVTNNTGNENNINNPINNEAENTTHNVTGAYKGTYINNTIEGSITETYELMFNDDKTAKLAINDDIIDGSYTVEDKTIAFTVANNDNDTYNNNYIFIIDTDNTLTYNNADGISVTLTKTDKTNLTKLQ